MDSTSSSSVAPCRLLDKLPAELRKNIYELSFSDNNQDTEVNLLKTTPPSKALLLTCLQANSEAQGLYKEAYRKYWTDTEFLIDGHGKEPYESGARAATKAALSAMRDEDLQQIRHICVRQTYPSSSEVTEKRLVDPRGGWILSSPSASKLEALGLSLYFVAARQDDGRPFFSVAVSKDDMDEMLSKSSTPFPMKWQLLSLTAHVDDEWVDAKFLPVEG